LDLPQKSTLLDTDYFRTDTIEAFSQYRYPQASPKNSNRFKDHDRITAKLRNRSYVVNHKRVLRLMRQDKLLCPKKKFKLVTTILVMGCLYIQTF
jgi:hypothetical protein